MSDSTDHEIERLNDAVDRLTSTVNRLEMMLRGADSDPDKSVLGRLLGLEIKVNAAVWMASSALVAALGAIAAKFIK